MDIVSFADVGATAWDAFCETSPDAWFRHTSTFIRFAHTLGDRSEDLSFALRHNGAIVAIVPLVAQGIPGTEKRLCAMGGTPIPFPAFAPGLSTHDREGIVSMIFAEIDTRAQAHGIALVRMFVDTLSDPVLTGRTRVNPLSFLGYQDTSIATVCIDLTLSEEELLERMADRRKRYILSAQRTQRYTTDVFDRETITREVFDAYKDLYFRTAGKVVGTPKRWEETFGWLRSGAGILVLVKGAGETQYRAGHLAMLYKKRAYDSISAILPQYKNDHDLGPLMQWEMMAHLKRAGYTRYEVGWLFPPTISETVYSKKERAISHFKSLFGGEVLPFFRGEKYYDMEYLRERRRMLTESFVAEQTDRS